MLVSEIIKKVPGPVSPTQPLQDLFQEDYDEGIDYLAVVEANKFIGFLPLADLETEKEIYQSVGQCELEKVDKPCLLLLKERDILRLEVGKKVDNVMGGRCFSLTFSY